MVKRELVVSALDVACVCILPSLTLTWISCSSHWPFIFRLVFKTHTKPAITNDDAHVAWLGMIGHYVFARLHSEGERRAVITLSVFLLYYPHIIILGRRNIDFVRDGEEGDCSRERMQGRVVAFLDSFLTPPPHRINKFYGIFTFFHIHVFLLKYMLFLYVCACFLCFFYTDVYKKIVHNDVGCFNGWGQRLSPLGAQLNDP